jgi:hypothetical protein
MFAKLKMADGSEGGPALKVQRWISNHVHLKKRKRVSEREREALQSIQIRIEPPDIGNCSKNTSCEGWHHV